jgi:hypothetical protein
MLTARALGGTMIVGSVAVASLLAATPAFAATLPSGQTITVIDYFEEAAAFFEASPADATLTSVGDDTDLFEDELSAVDVNDDGLGYAISNYSSDGFESTLYEANANTGTLTNPQTIVLDFGDVQTDADSCSALDYTDGVLMAICFEFINDDQSIAYWGTLDTDAAEGEAWLTPIYQFDDDQQTFEYLPFVSMAVHPVSGIVYAVANSDGWQLFTLSEDEGATFVTDMDSPAFGLDFDRGGQAWVTTIVEVGDEQQVSALATLNLVDGSNPFVEAMSSGGNEFEEPFIQPITVWGAAPPPAEEPVLPATGAEHATALGLGAAILLLGGALFAAGAATRRRAMEAN